MSIMLQYMGYAESDMKLSLLLAPFQFVSPYTLSTAPGFWSLLNVTSRSFIISAREGELLIIMTGSVMLSFPYLYLPDTYLEPHSEPIK